MKTREGPIIDEKNYSVTTINGYRVGNLTREQAEKRAARLVEEMKRAGWAGIVRIHYRDGSTVEKFKV